MNDAVTAVLDEREALDRGFPGGVILSSFAHLLLLGSAFLAAWLGATAPVIKAADGIAVPLPPGGGGPLEVAAGVAAPVKVAKPEPEREVAPEPPEVQKPPVEAPKPDPPKVTKPPKVETRKALPAPETPRTQPKPEPARRATATPTAAGPRSTNAGSPTGRPGGMVGTQGLGLTLPPGAGVPGGTDPNGDWYLAGVQRKIWMIWAQQVKAGFVRPVRISFTILADGSLASDSVQILETSGASLIDNAARRAVYSGAPFSPLPKHYGTARLTIQALFQPQP